MSVGIKTLKNGWNIFIFKNGFLNLKIKNKKCIGMSKFEFKNNLLQEIKLKPYSYLNGEPYLPPFELLESASKLFFTEKFLPNWFTIKLMLLSEIISVKTKTTSTVTTKQDRIPNIGLIINNGDDSIQPDIYLEME